MESGSFDKRLRDGTVIPAPDFTRRVLGGVPVLFQLAEWLAVIAVFQYADVKYHFVAAKLAWMTLGAGLALYFGVFTSNAAWRHIEDPYGTRWRNFAMSVLFPLGSGAVVFFLLKILLAQIVASH